MTTEITIIGGGLAGLTAAIACAEGGARVTLHEAHRSLGGRARSSAAPYVANDGPHVFYSDGEPWHRMAARGLVRPFRRPTPGELARSRFRYGGRLRHRPGGRRLAGGRLGRGPRHAQRGLHAQRPGRRAGRAAGGRGAGRGLTSRAGPAYRPRCRPRPAPPPRRRRPRPGGRGQRAWTRSSSR
ncbi:NAD(P)/FAD-dependent oxidoreductase [Planomonospora parontospora]|nr:NAD(P)/FAD-dependent oxidoreductase [Planomonospora parontospora]